MATYTFKGTGISGTSTTAKAFPKSKLGWARVGNTYLNKETGHVYKCTTAGYPAGAKWKYIRTDVVKKPTVGVTGIKLVREAKGSRVMKGTWNTPKAMVDAKRGDRATGLYLTWILDTSGSDVIDKESTKNENLKTDSENLSNFNIGNGTSGRRYTRESFYPYTGLKLYSVRLDVTPYNAKGRGSKGKKDKSGKLVGNTVASATYAFGTPRAPKVAFSSFNEETGVVTFKVDTDPGEDRYERIFTEYQMIVTDTSKATNKTWTQASNAKVTSTSFDLTYNVANWQSLTSDQYVKVEVKARARGFAGDSDWKSASYFVGFPKSVTIDAERITYTSRTSSGRITVPVKVNKSAEKPIDRIQLEVLADVAYAKASDIPASASWTAIEPGDDGNCTALTAPITSVVPAIGNHSWARVKAWHGSESMCSYSDAVELPLFVPAPSATDNECSIASAADTGDGNVDVCVVWDLKSSSADDDTTGIELSWSEDEGAWKSTKQPSIFEFAWEDASVPSSHSATWNKAGTVSVRDLEAGETYWFRARCLADDDEGRRTYGAYCNPVVVTVSSAPPSAVMSAPASAASGEGVPVSWVLSSSAAQDSWEIMNGTVPVFSGEGPATSTVIPAERVAACESGGKLSIFVRCHAGGATVDSNGANVVIAEPPSLVMTASTLTAQPLSLPVESTSQSVSIAYTVTADGADGSAPTGGIDQAQGDTVSTGVMVPALESTTWANSITYAMLSAELAAAQDAADAAEAELEDLEPGDDGYDEAMARYSAATADVAAITAAIAAGATGPALYKGALALPAGLAFVDGAGYTVTAVAIDSATGLRSDTVTAAFDVDWAHKAPEPPISGYEPTEDESVVSGKTYYELDADGSFVEVAEPVAADLGNYYEAVEGIEVESSVVEVDGDVTRSCTITLVAPDGAVSGDVYDVYRLTHDGIVRIGSGFPLDAVVTDRYATFGDAGDYRYRIACRTADGDERWSDYDYALDGDVLRFDFAQTSVELPYNIKLSDAYTKDSEYRDHLAGNTDAYWNQAVRRKSSLSTSIIRIEDSEKAARVREMAQHAGPVFVRTPDGSAYEADVQVKSLDISHNAIDAAFDAVKVADSGAFSLPIILQEDET